MACNQTAFVTQTALEKSPVSSWRSRSGGGDNLRNIFAVFEPEIFHKPKERLIVSPPISGVVSQMFLSRTPLLYFLN